MRPLPSGGPFGRSASLATARARPFWRLPLQGDAAGCRQVVQALQSPEMGALSLAVTGRGPYTFCVDTD